MNTRERARFDMSKRVGGYGTLYAADFTTPIPPSGALTSAPTKATVLFDALNAPATGLIARIDANATAQQAGAGDFHGGTTPRASCATLCCWTCGPSTAPLRPSLRRTTRPA